MPQVQNTEHEPIEPEQKPSKIRQVIKDRFDAMIAVGISAAIFSGAYFFRIAPQLNSIDEQMSGIGSQLTKVNTSIARLETNELFQLQVTSRDLMRRMDAVVTQTTTLSGELAAATTVAAQVRTEFADLQKALANYEAAVAAAAAPLEKPLPDIRGNADKLAARLAAADEQLGPKDKAFPKLYTQAKAVEARLDEAEKTLPAGKRKFPELLAEADALAKRIEEAQAKLGTKKQPFPDVAAAARDLQAEVDRVRKGLQGAILVCADLKDPSLLKQLKKRGHCK